jgi:hypothetical protein
MYITCNINNTEQLMSDLGIDSSKAKTDEIMGWMACLKGGQRIYEGTPTGVDGNGKLNISSDFLPADNVVALGYFPMRNKNHPNIVCNIDLDNGERFVRYWTTVQRVVSTGKSRLYALGWYKVIANVKRYAILYFYPNENKVVLCNSRYAGPPLRPVHTFALVQDAIPLGGINQGYVGWRDKYLEAYLINTPGGILFQSSMLMN